VNFLRRHLPYQ